MSKNSKPHVYTFWGDGTPPLDFRYYKTYRKHCVLRRKPWAFSTRKYSYLFVYKRPSNDVIKSVILDPPSWISLFPQDVKKKQKSIQKLFPNKNRMWKCINTAIMLKKTGKIIIWTKILIWKFKISGKPACYYAVTMATTKTADKPFFKLKCPEG